MINVRRHLSSRQESFKSHKFFENLDRQQDFTIGMSFVPKLTFWVMVFQDILHMIPPQIKTRSLRRLANHHKHEDAGHDQWFLQDAARLGNTNILQTAWLFSPEHRSTREMAYRIIAEAFQGNDHQKLLLILALESTGHVFFEKTADFINNKSQQDNFKYFSSYHLAVELNHAVFEQELEKDLDNIILSEGEKDQAIAMIDRVYDAFYTLFDDLALSFDFGSKEIKNNEKQLLVA